MGQSDSSSSPTVPVCGIGASAGGVEALQQFFQGLPTDLGLAYIVVVHLAPDHKSELAAILSRWTTMPVIQVGDHDVAKLEANHVYVIAPDRRLEITDSSVEARAFEQPRGKRTAVDLFFRSLAEQHGDGFAVVLSGGGSDGAVGAKAVKERGGLVLVQDPGEAAHPGMPRAAIAAGVADLVLPVRDLVTRLAELARNKERIVPTLRTAETSDTIPDEEEKALRGVLDVLRARTRHDFSRYKRTTVLRRVSRRMQLSDQLTIADYARFLRVNPAETQALFGDLLVSVTTFFRDPQAWDALKALVIGRLIDETPAGEQIRAWVPGCATGEEAYSLAIVFHEEFARRGIRRNLVIFATDVDESALAIAREGLYPQSISADLSDARLDRYFRPDGDHYRAVTELRDDLVFATHSILRDPPFSRLHLASCRNLLIYLERDLQEQVMSVFRYACRDDAYLFLGSAESAAGEWFQAIDKKHRVFQVRHRTHEGRLPVPDLLPRTGERHERHSAELRAAARPSAAERHVTALEEISSPTVLIDERWNVLHLSSSAARFFQQSGGPLARRITDLVRSELRDELHAILDHAMESDHPQLSPFVTVSFDGATHRVALLAQRRVRDGGAVDVLLTFLDAGEAVPDTSLPDDDPSRQAMASLRDKLRQSEQRIEHMRDDYHLTTEELRAANEELQSLNEEYRSTTEELETSKEELQSTNEELQSVNQQLQVKLDEVSRAHSDLENLMSATNVATLFLGLDLRIKWYTRQLEDIFHIKPRDLERPIGDLRHSLDYDELEDDARQVLSTTTPIERPTTSHGGRVFVARLSPYRMASDHAVDGVVATFVDVSAIRSAESALRLSERQLEAELAAMRRLHTMTVEVATAPTIHEALDHVVAAAIELYGADQAHVQLSDRETETLTIVAQRGLPASLVDRFVSLGADDAWTWRRAFRTGAIAQIGDVLFDETDPALCQLAIDAGYRSVQSTPLINRAGEVLGVLSVHFAHPHGFSERDSQFSTLLGRVAADLLDSRVRQLEVSANRAQMSEVRKLLGRLVGIQEEERRRIARDIHDQMGQPMTALRMHLQSLRASCEAYPEVMPDITRTERLAEELDQTIDFLTWEMRPASLDRLGLSSALADLVRAWSTRFRVPAEFHARNVDHIQMPSELAINVYRIVQEALHNVHKHARATRVTVLLDVRDGEGVIIVEDNGRGLPAEEHTTRRTGGLGFLSMRERAMLLGGTLAVESVPDQGTSIFVRVPLSAQADETADVNR